MLLQLLADSDSLEGDFVEFLEVGVVVVENGPELEIEEGCFFEQFVEEVFLCLQGYLSDQIQEFQFAVLFDLKRDEGFQVIVDVVLIGGELFLVNHQQFSEGQFLLAPLEEEDAVFYLQLDRDWVEFVPR